VDFEAWANEGSERGEVADSVPDNDVDLQAQDDGDLASFFAKDPPRKPDAPTEEKPLGEPDAPVEVQSTTPQDILDHLDQPQGARESGVAEEDLTQVDDSSLADRLRIPENSVEVRNTRTHPWEFENESALEEVSLANDAETVMPATELGSEFYSEIGEAIGAEISLEEWVPVLGAIPLIKMIEDNIHDEDEMMATVHHKRFNYARQYHGYAKELGFNSAIDPDWLEGQNGPHVLRYLEWRSDLKKRNPAAEATLPPAKDVAGKIAGAYNKYISVGRFDPRRLDETGHMYHGGQFSNFELDYLKEHPEEDPKYIREAPKSNHDGYKLFPKQRHKEKPKVHPPRLMFINWQEYTKSYSKVQDWRAKKNWEKYVEEVSAAWREQRAPDPSTQPEPQSGPKYPQAKGRGVGEEYAELLTNTLKSYANDSTVTPTMDANRKSTVGNHPSGHNDSRNRSLTTTNVVHKNQHATMIDKVGPSFASDSEYKQLRRSESTHVTGTHLNNPQAYTAPPKRNLGPETRMMFHSGDQAIGAVHSRAHVVKNVSVN